MSAATQEYPYATYLDIEFDQLSRPALGGRPITLFEDSRHVGGRTARID
jgi:hypothetical protein